VSLELQGLCVDIDGTPIVRDVDLVVPDGALVGLLGPNGSGKSTLLKSLYRVHQPSAGRVLLDGTDLSTLRPRAAARRIAVLAQESAVEFDLTVADMVLLGRTPHKGHFDGDNEQDLALAADAIARVGCSHLADRSFLNLSGGEKQRVLVARALTQGADHLILDEPTNHLDIRYQIEVLELVAGLGLTVLAALHDLGLAALFCDSVHLLAAGRLVAGGTPTEVITPHNVLAVYDAEVLVVTHPDTGTPQILPRRVGAAHPLPDPFDD
jgi:iron complex transport system ATP-binding protein